MKCRPYVPVISAILLTGLPLSDARGDGGIVRMRDIQGPLAVTVFTASEPLQDRLTDVSVMVQRRGSSDAVLDAKVDLMFTGPPTSTVEICGPTGATPSSPSSESGATPFTLTATRQQASNKLFYAAPVTFGAAGTWRLRARVESGGEIVSLAGNIPVGSPAHGLSGIFPYLLLPPALVLLFVARQQIVTSTARENIPAKRTP